MLCTNREDRNPDCNICRADDFYMWQKCLVEDRNNYKNLLEKTTMHIKIISELCGEQIRAQKGEFSYQSKFNTIEQFASYIKAIADLSLETLK